MTSDTKKSKHRVAIIDTNFLLGSVPLQQINWRKELDCHRITLVACMTVVRQLDRKKSPRLRDRARSRLSQIESADGSEIAPHVTIRIDPDDFRADDFPSNLSPDIEDDHILLRALKYANESDAVVITRDGGLRIKAKALGLQVLGLDNYADEPAASEVEEELRRLKRENAELRDQIPRLRVECMVASSYRSSDAPARYTLQRQAPLLDSAQELTAARRRRKQATSGYDQQLALNVGTYDAHRYDADWDHYLDELDSYFNKENKRRERAHLSFPLRIVLKNEGRVAAEAIRIELQYPPDRVRPRNLSVFTELVRPLEPKKMPLYSINEDDPPEPTTVERRTPESASAPVVNLEDGRWTWAVPMIRPGDEVELADWAMQFLTPTHVGAFPIEIRVSARNLPKPVRHTRTLVFEELAAPSPSDPTI